MADADPEETTGGGNKKNDGPVRCGDGEKTRAAERLETVACKGGGQGTFYVLRVPEKRKDNRTLQPVRERAAHLVQRMEGGVAARQFDTYAVYRKGAFDTPELSFWEGRRLILWKDGTAQAFYYGEYKDRKMHWIETKPTSYISPYYDRPDNCSRRGAVYRRTLPDLVRKELKKTGLLEMVRAQKYASPEEILLSVKEEPVLEKAAKAGLVTLAIDLMHSSCLFEFGKSGRLHHCINRTDHYYERIVKRESYILFIRKTDQLSVPYYTVEAEPDGTIRQIRAEYNRQKEDFEDISEFMKKWQREIARRLTKADREKSAASRKLRKQEYEQLRKAQVRIGQGTYEGQLLADILEADLMEMPEAA